MSEYNDLVRALRHLLMDRLEQRRTYIHGLLGNGAGQVSVPDEPDKSYVRPSKGSSVVWEVFNKEVSGPDGWPILIGELPWQPGFVQVVGTDWSAWPDQNWGDDVGGLRRHARQHEWKNTQPGTDPLRVHIRAMEPLKTYPIGSGSMSVLMSPYDYTYGTPKSWPGTPSLDLSGAQPSSTGTARVMLTYLDVNTNTIGAWSGTVGSFGDAFRLLRPSLPTATYLPSAYVRLYGGQTTIREQDIWDARQPWSLMFTGTSAGGGAPTGPAGGDLTGTYPDPLVAGIYGYPYGLEVPAEGQVLMFTGSAWRPVTMAAGGGSPTGPAGGDLSGTYPNPDVVGLFGTPLVDTAPNEGQVLLFTGSAWRPADGPGIPASLPPTGPAGGDLTGSYPNPTVVGLYGYPVANIAPGQNEVLSFTGTAWRPVAFDGWKLGNTVVVSDSGRGDYTTLADALDEIVTNTLVLIDQGFYALDDLTLPEDCYLVGMGRQATTLQVSSGGTGLTIGGSSSSALIQDLSITNELPVANGHHIGISLKNASGINLRMVNVYMNIQNSGATGTSTAIDMNSSNTLYLYDCDVSAIATSDCYGVEENGNGYLYLYGGSINTIMTGTGTEAAIAGAASSDLSFYNLPSISDNITGGGAQAGVYEKHTRGIMLTGAQVVFDEDADSYMYSSADDQIDLVLQYTGTFAFTPAGLLGQNTTRPNLGGVSSSEKWGSIYMASGTDAFPDAMGKGVASRLTCIGPGATTDHFRSGVIPTGFSWQGSPFYGTPGTVIYDYAADYLLAAQLTTSRAFLAKSSGVALGSYVFVRGVPLYQLGGVGARIDDGTDNNYYQIFIEPSGTGTMRLTFQERVGGAGVSTIGSTAVWPSFQMPAFALLCYGPSPPTHYGATYFVQENGVVGGTGLASSTPVTWTPARYGLFFPVNGSYVYGMADWFLVT